MIKFTVGQILTLNAEGAECMNRWLSNWGSELRVKEDDEVVSHENDDYPYCSPVTSKVRIGDTMNKDVVSLNEDHFK